LKILPVERIAAVTRLADQGLEAKLSGRREADFPFDLTAWRDQVARKESFGVVLGAVVDFGGSTHKNHIRAELVNSVGTLSICSCALQVEERHLVRLPANLVEIDEYQLFLRADYWSPIATCERYSWINQFRRDSD
jgi:hypothetical protein